MLSTPCLRSSKFFSTLLLVLALSACAGKPVVALPADPAQNLLEQARQASFQGQDHQALRLYLRAYQQASGLDDAAGRMNALLGATQIHLLQENLQAAEAGRLQLQRLEQADELPQELRHQSRYLQARVLAATGDVTAARALLAPQLDTEDLLGESARLLDCRLQTGDTNCLSVRPQAVLNQARWLRLKAQRSEDAAQAQAWRRQALDLYREQRHRHGIAASLQELGEHAAPGWQNGQSCDYWLRSLQIRAWLQHTAGSQRLLDSAHLQRCAWPPAITPESLLESLANGDWNTLQIQLQQLEQALSDANATD